MSRLNAKKNMIDASGTPETHKICRNKNPHANISARRLTLFHNVPASWFSNPMCSSCANTSRSYFHETKATCFQPVQTCHLLIFLNLRFMCSAFARTPPFNFDESRARVFSLRDWFLPSFSSKLNTWVVISFHRFIYRNNSPRCTAHFRKSVGTNARENNNHKTSNPKWPQDFISPTLFWTLPEQFFKLHCAFPQICLEPMSQEKIHRTLNSKLRRGLSTLNIILAGIIHNHSCLQNHPLWQKNGLSTTKTTVLQFEGLCHEHVWFPWQK